MKKLLITFLCFYISLYINANSYYSNSSNNEHRRVIVTTDLGGTDPDDEESMVHLLFMANDVDIEGLICQMAFVKSTIGIKPLRKIIDFYKKALPTLRIHDKNYPSTSYLHSIATTGQTEVGMKGVGEGCDTPGSELIIKAVDKKDSRPVWLTAWGGMNTIAQALWKVSHTRTSKELALFISKIRIYDILGQCDAGAWIAHTFPDIIYIRNRDVYGWGPSDEWISKNVQAFSPLGKVYPSRVWAPEGDSPAFMYLVDNGLNMPEQLDAGGWGGRFETTRIAGQRGMDWVQKNQLDETQYDPYYMFSNTPEGGASITRWKEQILNDFAARVQWSVTKEYSKANHHPNICMANENKHSRKIIFKDAKPGSRIKLNASSSNDPDGNKLSWNYYFYKEPSHYKGDVIINNSDSSECIVNIPSDAEGKRLHVILEVKDDGNPQLTSYRRIVINVTK